MKWMMIPRVLRDIIGVLLQGTIPFAERWMLAGVLCRLKWQLQAGSGAKTVKVRLAGRQLELPNHADTQFVLREIWLDEVYLPIAGMHPASVLDLGANVGLAGLFFRNRFPSLGEIVMLEPDPANFAMLRANMPEAELHREAVGVRDGMGRIEGGGGEGVMNHTVSPLEGGGVVIRSMRGLLARPFDLVKMDIEGAEWDILADLAGEPEILGSVRYWMIEFHEGSQFAGSRKQIDEAFASLGYKNVQKGNVIHYFDDRPMQLK
jgi:FkbM family methyltransferase